MIIPERIEMTHNAIMLSISGVPILSKITLRNMISLWDIHNKQVHMNIDSKWQKIMKGHQIIKFKNFMLYNNDLHQSDLGIFPEDKEKFIEQLTVHQLQDYVAIHWKKIQK